MRWFRKFHLLITLLLFPLIKGFSISAISHNPPNPNYRNLVNSLLPTSPFRVKQDVALVASLDGTVHLVDTNSREIRWSFSSGPPIYSSYQASINNDDDNKHNASELSNDLYYIDCGDDWELYVHSKRFGKLRKLGDTADEYIRRTPYVSDDGEITLGLKKTTAFLVDAKTGKVIKTYRIDNFPSMDVETNAIQLVKDVEGPDTGNFGEPRHEIYVTRKDYVLQHYSQNSSQVLWNVAFADIEADFRCPGIDNSFGGISSNAGEDGDEIQWHFPCHVKTAVIRIRDNGLLDIDKLRIAYLGDGASFLPATDVRAPAQFLPGPNRGAGYGYLSAGEHVPFSGPIPRPQLALPANEDGNILALPTSEIQNLRMLEPSTRNVDVMTTTGLSLEIVEKYLNWPVVAAILSLVGFICYNLLAFRKQDKLNKPVEEAKMKAGVSKKKKSRKSGNNCNSPSSERRQNNVSVEDIIGDINGHLNAEGNNTTLSHEFGNILDGPVDGRRIGKLLVSNKEIARGSNGTVVLEGIYDGRAVAVKRLVQTHHNVALKEIQNLIASDYHPNIVRWYGVEYDQDFVYIALERCTCSLNDFIYVSSESFQSQKVTKNPDSIDLHEHTVQLHSILENNRNLELWKPNGHPSAQLLKLMRDVVSGLAHLHELGIIHRDLKPQNVLIISDKSFGAKISDMGISKRLVGDVSSLTKQATGYGSSGWQAPEQLLQGRQTRAIDLFSLGCVLFFCISGGKHPFGDSIERDVNIVNKKKDLFLVEHIPEAVDLLSGLLDSDPDKRPKAKEVFNHPLFWTPEKRLSFLQDISDRVELEDRENESELLDALEGVATVALNGKWDEKMEAVFINNIGRYRRYKYDSIRDLLRVIRNKSHHYRELPQEIKELMGSHPEGFEGYFSCRFPKLLIEVYKVIFRHCKEEEFFRKYREVNAL